MKVSIVIPCYNQGHYIQDAIDSVISYNEYETEIIIIDDGSTDEFTIEKLAELKKSGLNVIHQKNSGLAFTRNRGIKLANAQYILPLDADNRISHNYISKAVKLLDCNDCDIVYAKPIFFGENDESRKFKTKEFDGSELIFCNYIDACAIFRKEVWTTNKGYDENMPHQGVEDWEFWLNSYFNNFRFHFINEELYYYRITLNSMTSKISLSNKNSEIINYITGKYGNLIMGEMAFHFSQSKIYSNDIKNPVRSIFKYIYRCFILKPKKTPTKNKRTYT